MIRQGVYAVVFRTQRLRYIQPTAIAAADLAAAYATAYKGTVSKGADEAAATAESAGPRAVAQMYNTTTYRAPG
jgi:hypothetical protein